MVGLLWLNSTRAGTAFPRDDMTLLCDVAELTRAGGYTTATSEPVGCLR